jgi:alpha-ketoglutarate-dependent taurine dioxygenase
MFCCLQPASEGGETPIADSRVILDHLSAETLEAFERRDIRYVRNMHGGDGHGLSWQAAFQMTDRESVARYCRQAQIEHHWTSDGGLTTAQIRPAIRRHPVSGERVWFNQAHQWHSSNFGSDVSAALEHHPDGNTLPLSVTFGDGAPLPASMLAEIRSAITVASVTFPWIKGDMLLLDNMLVAHGRNPFRGPRRVLVALGKANGQAVTPQEPS